MSYIEYVYSTVLYYTAMNFTELYALYHIVQYNIYRNTFVMFAKEIFEYPELEEHPLLCNHLGGWPYSTVLGDEIDWDTMLRVKNLGDASLRYDIQGRYNIGIYNIRYMYT